MNKVLMVCVWDTVKHLYFSESNLFKEEKLTGEILNTGKYIIWKSYMALINHKIGYQIGGILLFD